uniref:Autophagy-related protein n=1 Tax=Hymenolepis diminuta TaxID=6216 RepID=A0A158QG23_HYMDI
LLRSTSIGIEHANIPSSMLAIPKSVQVNGLSSQHLSSILSYSLYPPTFLFGPITLYGDWCSSRQYEVTNSVKVPLDYRGCLTTRILSCKNLVLRAFRLVFWVVIWEVVIHTVYPSALVYSMTKPIMHVPSPPLDSNATTFHGSPFIQTDRSAPGCAVYLLGMQFYFTYLQLYGWPRWFSDLDVLLTNGVSDDGVLCLVPEGPQCFSLWVLINILQIFFEQLIKWAYKSTQFGDTVRARLSPNNIQRLTGILCSISGMLSSVGFFFFNLGYSSGTWILYLMFFDPSEHVKIYLLKNHK